MEFFGTLATLPGQSFRSIPMSGSPPSFLLTPNDRPNAEARLVFAGEWTVARLGALERELAELAAPNAEQVVFDLEGVSRLDSAGAWLAVRLRDEWMSKGKDVRLLTASPEHDLVLARVAHASPEPPPAPAPRLYILEMLDRSGRELSAGVLHTLRQVGFFGLLLKTLARTMLRPARLRLTSAVHHMEATGINAVPIVALLSFLIGTVMVFVGAQQLERFGAQIFAVNLLEIAVFREMGVLLTAIIVAGRSGSAFTAQIGSMKVNQEVDAMRSMGLDPMEMLVLPRCLALLVTLPLLTFLADMMGIVGGGLMCWLYLDISPAEFLERFRALTWPWHFWVGLIKAPFYALVIAVIGCFEGFEVSGSSASVGERTTQSVVESIFWIIVLNAFFASFFSMVGL